MADEDFTKHSQLNTMIQNLQEAHKEDKIKLRDIHEDVKKVSAQIGSHETSIKLLEQISSSLSDMVKAHTTSIDTIATWKTSVTSNFRLLYILGGLLTAIIYFAGSAFVDQRAEAQVNKVLPLQIELGVNQALSAYNLQATRQPTQSN